MARADFNEYEYEYKGMESRVTERLRELGLENNDLSSGLAEHSRETRDSKDPPVITENLVQYCAT